jgi:CRISPR/Cas system-associated exonuclease Cas4 (RecB family)
MPCIGINCSVRNEKVSFIECQACEKCNNFPTILKKKFTFPSVRQLPPKISVTLLVSCPRQSYLKLTQDYHMDVTSLIATNIGTAIHEYVKGISDISEKFIRWVTPEGNSCIGYLDAINISRRMLYEIKTTPHGWYMRDSGPKARDSLQLQMYATILKEAYKVQLNGLRLVYIGLGDRECMELEVPYADQSAFMNDKVNLLQKHLDSNTAPKGEPMWPEWECKYCPFSAGCPDKVIVETKKGTTEKAA